MQYLYRLINSLFDYDFKENINDQHLKMLADIKKYGSFQEGTYNGIKWSMKRPFNTNWCGYILYDKELTDIEYNRLGEHTHRGLTFEYGFDCSHAGDYCPMDHNLLENGIYRDYDFVLLKLYGMIDYLASLNK
jgi:hypothetical protein